MKTFKFAICLLAALLLSACASTTPGGGGTKPTMTDTYMYHTERNAQARMATVYWLNPPKSEDLKKSAERGQ
jgi:hypothetical protein